MIYSRPLLCGITFLMMSNVFISAYGQKESELVANLRAGLFKGAEDIPEPPTIMKGTIKMGKMPFDGAIYYHNPNNRMELSMQGITFIAFQNDTINWSYDPTSDKHTITFRSKEDAALERQRELRFDFASKDLLNYKSRGHKLRHTGKTKLDSLEVNGLELSMKNGSVTRFFLDTRTHLVYKIVTEDGYRVWANYSRYGDYVYPSTMITEFNGERMEMIMNDIAINVPIPDSLLTVPSEAFAATRKDRENINHLLVAGDSLYAQGDFVTAIERYTEVIMHDADNYLAYNSRGLSKIGIKKYYEAIADFNIALEKNPDGSTAFNNRGLAKFYIGDNGGAIEDYSTAIRLDSTLVVAYKNRGLIYLRSQKYAEAADDFLNATKWKPSDGESHFKYAVAIAQKEQFDDALQSYEKALMLDYKTAEIYNYRGVSEYKLERYDSAATSFGAALELEPGNLQYLENYGNALYRSGNYSGALEQFEKYKSVKSDKAEIHNMIGLCKYRDEDYQGAIQDFTRGIELSPKSAVYFDNRASAKEQINDYEGAISDYTQSIAVYPNDPEVFYKRGLVKILTSKKIEGCMDLGTANEMKYEPAKDAILANCH